MTDLMRLTKGEEGYQCGEGEGERKSADSRQSQHLQTQGPGYDECVMQGLADGHKAVVGHRSHEETLCPAQGAEEMHLQGSAQEGHPLAPGQETGQHAGDDDPCIADFNGGQVAKEEIHGVKEGDERKSRVPC